VRSDFVRLFFERKILAHPGRLGPGCIFAFVSAILGCQLRSC
jgi:hypothetical protein